MDDKEYEILFSHEFEEKENLVNMIALENNNWEFYLKLHFIFLTVKLL